MVRSIFISFALVFSFFNLSKSQTISKPEIKLTSVGGLNTICKGTNVEIESTYTVWNSFPNNYSIQISDKNGDFTTTVDADIVNITDDNVNKKVNIFFTLSKITSGGTNYKLRITSAGTTSPESDSFIYIIPVSVTINTDKNIICEGEEFTLTASGAVPLKGSFSWYTINPSISLVGNKNPIKFKKEGSYRLIFKGGVCESEDLITISKLNMEETMGYNPPLANCAFTEITLSVNGQNPKYTYKYQWYKDNVKLTSETSSTITINTSGHGSGLYYVNVTATYNGKTCSNKLADIDIKLKPNKPQITSAEKMPICQTTNNIKNVKLTANNISNGAKLQWLKDGNPINGATSKNYDVIDAGKYKIITTLGNCKDTSDEFEVSVIKIKPFDIKSQKNYNDCDNETLKIINTVDVEASDVTYTWYKDGKELSGKNDPFLDILAVDNVNGVYKLRKQENTDNSCELFSKDFPVKLKPRVIISSNKLLPLCGVGKVELSVTSNSPSGRKLSYKWFKNNVVITDNLGNPITSQKIEIDVADKKIDKYKVEVDDGVCKSFSNQLNASVLSNNVYKILLPNDYSDCSKNEVILTANANLSPQGFKYEWFQNGALIPNNSKSRLIVKTTSNLNGNGKYKLKITHKLEGCSIETDEVEVKLKPNTPSILDGKNVAICKGHTIDLNIKKNNSSNYYNKFAWFKDKNKVGSDKILKGVGVGTYQVEACENTCCAKSIELKVEEVDPNDFKISAAKKTICQGDKIKVNAPYSNYSNVKYNWFRNGKPFITKDNNLEVTLSGEYYAKVVISKCEIITNKLKIEVKKAEGVGVDKEIAYIDPNESAVFNAFGGDSFFWYEKNADGSLNLVHQKSQFKTPPLNSDKSYVLKIKSKNSNCEYTIDILAKVLSGGINEENISNFITPNADGKNDNWIIPDKFASKKDVRVTIFNRQGNIVLDQYEYKNDWNGTYNGNKLPEGTYFYIIKLDNKEIKGFITVFE